jgi:DNA-binding NarL/FixJ family response regulator
VDLDPGSEPPGDGAPVRWAAHGSARLVVLLDLVMPGLDGAAVLVALRDHPLRDRMRVLVLTTYGGQSSMRRALSLGADGYLLKDSTAQQLATALRAVAGGLTTLSPAAGARREPAPARRRLTARESEVLHLLGEGLSNRDIARRLGLTERTVKIHVSAVLGKLGVQSRTQAALMAWEEKPAAESTGDAT